MRRAIIVWFTGLSGSGKTTVAEGVRLRLAAAGWTVYILDGDAVRAEYSRPLGFSRADVGENNRRIAERCAALRGDADVILVPIIAPYADARAAARALLAPDFLEAYCNADLACVVARDVKGLYARAKVGAITDMIGYAPAYPYEPPSAPDLMLHTGSTSVEASIAALEAQLLAMHMRVGVAEDRLR